MATELERPEPSSARGGGAGRKDADATMLCAMAKRFGTDVGSRSPTGAAAARRLRLLSEYGIEKIVRDLRVHQSWKAPTKSCG